jgi:hypothetical protein
MIVLLKFQKSKFLKEILIQKRQINDSFVKVNFKKSQFLNKFHPKKINK